MFVDQVKIFVKGGKGGDGVVSFRREKYVPLGGPDGGNGGGGGDVVLAATEQKSTLIDMSYRPHLHAANGSHESGKKKHGKNASKLEIQVPVGTVIKDEDGKVLVDLSRSGMKAVVARGGRGGRGNAHFATSRRRVPEFAEKGEPGEERTLVLELKLLADVGLVGFPNAGKSTLLSRVSSARPKIANFPFTTLVPQLGVVSLGEGRSFVLADLPGIIEDAHRGAGLGHQFLRHIERTRVLVFLMDMAATEGRDPYQDFLTLRSELGQYRPDLLSRPYVVAANKMDLPEGKKHLETFLARVQKDESGEGEEPEPEPVYPISSATGEGIERLLNEIYLRLETLRAMMEEDADEEGQEEEGLLYLEPLKEPHPLRVEKDGPVFVVSGDVVETLVLRTNFERAGSAARFQEMIRKQGVEEELLKKGIQEGDTVRIGDLEFTYYPDGLA